MTDVNKISHVLPVNVRDGVPVCPHCGDTMIELKSAVEGVHYQCRTGKTFWDTVARELRGAFDE